jgi:hypothetical protein
MVDENKVPQDDELSETRDDAPEDSELSADVISEDDLVDAAATLSMPESNLDPVEQDESESEGNVDVQKNLEDIETEVLPEVPDELKEEWQKTIREDDETLVDDIEPAQDAVEAELDEPPVSTDDVDSAVEEIPERPIYSSPPPSKPAWKVHAEEIFSEREAKRQQMLEARRKLDEARQRERVEAKARLDDKKAELDAEIKEEIEAKAREKQQALDVMLERIREDREKKRQERAAVDEQLRQEREARRYKKQKAVNDGDDKGDGHDGGDVDERVNRLSKPED